MKKTARRTQKPSRASRRPAEGETLAGAPSATAVAGEAAATGVVPLAGRSREEEMPREGRRLQMGDPDTRPLDNAYVGDETAVGNMATPDQGDVDEVGRVLGVQDADNGELRATSELLDERDRTRSRRE